MKSNSRCQRPDRDAPKLRCGYPLPCPHHTVVLDILDLKRQDDLLPEKKTILRKYRQERFVGVRKYKCRTCAKVVVKTGISAIAGHELMTLDYVVLADHSKACTKKETK